MYFALLLCGFGFGEPVIDVASSPAHSFAAFGPCHHEIMNWFTQFLEIETFGCTTTWTSKRSIGKEGKMGDYDYVFVFSPDLAHEAIAANTTPIAFGGGPGLNPRRFATPAQLVVYLARGLYEPLSESGASLMASTYDPPVSFYDPPGCRTYMEKVDNNTLYFHDGDNKITTLTRRNSSHEDESGTVQQQWVLDPPMDFPFDIKGHRVLAIRDMALALAALVQGATVFLWGPDALELAQEIHAATQLDIRDFSSSDTRWGQKWDYVSRFDLWAASGMHEFIAYNELVIANPRCIPHLGSYATLAAMGTNLLLRGLHPDAGDYFEDLVAMHDNYSLGIRSKEETGILKIPIVDPIVPEFSGEFLSRNAYLYGGHMYVKVVWHQSERGVVQVSTTFGGASQEAMFLHILQGRCAPYLVYFEHEAGKWSAVTMEYIQGVRLDVFLRYSSRKRKIAMAEKIVNLLHCLWDHGVQHNDLWPPNLLVQANMDIFPLDFGLATLGGEYWNVSPFHHPTANEFLTKYKVDPSNFVPMAARYTVDNRQEGIPPMQETDRFLVGMLLRYLGHEELLPLSSWLMQKPELSFDEIRERTQNLVYFS